MPENTAFLDNLGNLRYYKSVINNANTRSRSSANATASFFVFFYPYIALPTFVSNLGELRKISCFDNADKAVYE